MPNKTYTSVPENYPVCLSADCPMASTCLHYYAYTQAARERACLSLVNPKQCSKDARCRHYSDAKPVAYAYGFRNFQEKMFPQQYRRFMRRLIGQFGRTSYFDRRRGATPISPREQKIILAALREVGIREELKFDSYKENICWYD